MKTKNSIYFILITILLTTLVLSACGGPQAKPVEGAERDAVLLYSEPAADNVLLGINDSDYATFSSPFNATLAKSLNEAEFAKLQQAVLPKVGKYVSREVDSVLQDDKYVTLIYKAKFEQEDGVTVRLVFDKTDTHPVSGLWFDSPKLRQK